VVIEEWLIDDKAVDSLSSHYRIVTGRATRETDDAILISQGSDESWIPKSCSRSFVLAPGAGEIAVPQTGLTAFGPGDSDD